MLVPETYGFKSIKWLNQIVLTNDYRANDTYATEAGDVPYVPDPSTPMKTLARLDVHAPAEYARGQPIHLRGMVTVGASGLKGVEYWLRPDQGMHGKLDPDDPAWATARWQPASLPAKPAADWAESLPEKRFPKGTRFLDDTTQSPTQWPLPFSWVPWQVTLEGLGAGAYEFRVRAIDMNDFAQPEPRPNPQSGIAEVPCQTFLVT